MMVLLASILGSSINFQLRLLVSEIIKFGKDQAKKPWVQFVFSSVIIFLLICLSKFFTNRFVSAKVATEIYQNPNLILSYTFAGKYNLLTLALVFFLTGASYFLNRKTQLTKTEKIILFSCTGIIWFSSVCIPPNWYFNQIYAFDRLLLSVLFISIFFRPYLVLLFWFLSLLFIKQLQSDFFYFSFSDKKILYELVLLSFLYFNFNRFFKIPVHFYFLAVWTVISLWYFLAGYGKVELEFWHTKLVNFFLVSLAYGWLHDMQQLQELLNYFISKSNLLLVILTLVAELGVILFFVNKKGAILLSIMLWSMHLIIFIISGLFFWKWMILNIAILLIVLFIGETKPSFSIKFALLNSIFIFALGYLFKDTKLSWLDAGIVNYHRFSVVSDQKKIPLDASFFSPYDFVFAQNRFFILEDKPVLMGSYGTIKVNRDIYFEILNSKGDQLKQIISQYGKNSYDPSAKDRFIEFISTFIKNKNLAKYSHLPFYAPNHKYQGENQKKTAFSNSTVTDLVIDYYEIDMRDMNAPDTLTHRSTTINLEK